MVGFGINKNLLNSLGCVYREGYDSAIAFFVWKDYSLADYTDNVVHSKEYLLNQSVKGREDFLDQQVAKFGSPEKLIRWQYNQLFFALGGNLSVLRDRDISYTEVQLYDVALFKDYCEVAGATLAEAILYKAPGALAVSD